MYFSYGFFLLIENQHAYVTIGCKNILLNHDYNYENIGNDSHTNSGTWHECVNADIGVNANDEVREENRLNVVWVV